MAQEGLLITLEASEEDTHSLIQSQQATAAPTLPLANFS